MSNVQVERGIILDILRSFADEYKVSFNLRALPPPGGGWYIEVAESSLQELKDQRREDLLTRLAIFVTDANKLGLNVGIIRSLDDLPSL